MFEVRDLTIRQGGLTLWQDMTLRIKGGERLGLFAPSGHGKTTLGRVLAGWQPALGGTKQGGRVLLDGTPLPHKGYNPVQLVPQHPELSFNPYRSTGQSLWDVWQPGEAMLARFLVKPEWLSRKPGQLSGGELARIALLRALDPRTRVLIADEVTAQLDPQTQLHIWQQLLLESERRELGMIVFSHQRALLRQICGRVLIFGGDERQGEMDEMASNAA